jgi:hypothetical protein
MRSPKDGNRLHFLQGATLERISFDYAVTLHFGDGKEIRIETDMSISTPTGERVEVFPEFPGTGAESYSACCVRRWLKLPPKSTLGS